MNTYAVVYSGTYTCIPNVSVYSFINIALPVLVAGCKQSVRRSIIECARNMQ